MNITDRINDILSTNNFSEDELKHNENTRVYSDNSFESIEYHSIMHFTNEELYYISDEELDAMNETADLIEDTKNSRFYCFK